VPWPDEFEQRIVVDVGVGGDLASHGGPPPWRSLSRSVEQQYPQFAGAPSAEAGGPVLAVDIKDWSGWAYS
jgi:hypothetical protein